MRGRGLGGDSHAMRKLDTIIEAEDPYQKEVGGPAYLPKERKESSVVGLYKDREFERQERNEKSKAINTVIVATVCAFIVAAVVIVCIV